jgi:hypothetical protein
MIPIPDFDSDESGPWEKASTRPHYQLKSEALAELRFAIRKERKERREGIQSWTALTIGLIGALIGLLSAFRK